MTDEPTATRGLLAYDAASGRILHAHFTRLPAPEPGAPDAAEAALRRLLAAETIHRAADVRVLHVAGDALPRGERYRVDAATGTLVAVGAGERGLTVSAGSSRRRAR